MKRTLRKTPYIDSTHRLIFLLLRVPSCQDTSLIINVDYYLYCLKEYAHNYKEVIIVCDLLREDWEREYMARSKGLRGQENIQFMRKIQHWGT